MKEKTIIIVGGGQAAAMAAASLRQQGFTGELHLFSDERHLPYERSTLEIHVAGRFTAVTAGVTR